MKKYSIKELVKKIQDKEISCVEVVDYYIKEIEKKEDKIDAFLLLQTEDALKKAKELDEKIAKGEKVGRLVGIPIAIKDNMCTRGVKTTCASKMLEDFVPPYDATVIKKLEEEDAILIGKTNLDEFAMGSSTENSAFKITKNPIDITRVPGGSSGGSAAAVGAKMVPLALGSDTGGSIRQPASFCGIVGMKPTYGLVSRYGLIAFGSSLDQIGPFSMTVEDNAYLLNILAGEDELDGTTAKGLDKKDYTENIDSGIEGMKIGIPKEFIEEEGLDSEIKDVILKDIEALRQLGAEVEEFSLPTTKDGLAPYYIISSAEASSNLARFDSIRYGYRTKEFTSVEELVEKSRSEGFGREVKRRIMLGTYALSSGYYDAYYNKAQKFRAKLKQDFKEAFKKYDIIIGPVSPILPFKIGERCEDPTAMYLADIYTININLATVPALSMPGGKSSDGLPIGLQLIGDVFTEEKIYKVAYALEKKLNLEFERGV
ncbi:MAG: Asp-tRNA(Asn)/Glu-tRNA(Gln) amidotransferase subunit GatA [Clostridiales bacterium]|uniref:Asp-tRNA(Asn)/Glu-tRNA(Gln) amidotransferase subunit GatA n=1 Tax=Terrisporobacter sp. TaxID=1965305 RepID=UPI002A4E7FBE|nr:Asp-tRNA(Asn)/Glu-tRNA(Gln) amidotransferase subunit GatA [Terrisporobacter sp.]MDD7757515.1 Asp-tRNA(Asn)/Glu-tRNA(Gln) amidotransferase subunit GatA [Clostridiales bacterium]MDY4135855.1 Asp-tRNA(Asn)/Glu-tRNA(Gln) amidotransferase subunit GatA [Terrisporobacter sp.]